MTIVHVVWTDAVEYEGWGPQEDIGKPLITAGLLILETDDVLYVARDYDQDSRQWRAREGIPKQMIQKLTRFEVV